LRADGTLKIRKKLCRRCLIGEGLFARKVGNDLLYERTTILKRGLSLDFLAHLM
jgi:hypothetical protein